MNTSIIRSSRSGHPAVYERSNFEPFSDLRRYPAVYERSNFEPFSDLRRLY